MTAVVIVLAAGRGERLGPGTPKALRLLGGVPMLVHAVRAVAFARAVDAVVVAAPPDQVAAVRTLLADHDVAAELRVVPGGGTRQESVRAALGSLPDDVQIVLVHDAARPLVPSELVDAVVAAVRDGAEAVVPALAVTDTVKRVSVCAEGGETVLATVDRAGLRAAQTPQGFRRSVLTAAHEATQPGDVAVEPTDDAGLVERAGGTVRVVPGAEEAFKVTRPIDLMLAEAVLARRRSRV